MYYIKICYDSMQKDHFTVAINLLCLYRKSRSIKPWRDSIFFVLPIVNPSNILWRGHANENRRIFGYCSTGWALLRLSINLEGSVTSRGNTSLGLSRRRRGITGFHNFLQLRLSRYHRNPRRKSSEVFLERNPTWRKRLLKAGRQRYQRPHWQLISFCRRRDPFFRRWVYSQFMTKRCLHLLSV